MLQQTTLLGQDAMLSAIGRADVGSQLKKNPKTPQFYSYVLYIHKVEDS